jgi:hypothetical protein
MFDWKQDRGLEAWQAFVRYVVTGHGKNAGNWPNPCDQFPDWKWVSRVLDAAPGHIAKPQNLKLNAFLTYFDYDFAAFSEFCETWLARQQQAALYINLNLSQPKWLSIAQAHQLYEGVPVVELSTPFRPLISPDAITELLSWRTELTPLVGREAETEDLHAWCQDAHPFKGKIISGEGGVGKTRLIMELARKLKTERWNAGAWNPNATEVIYTLGEQGVLFVIDYPEENIRAVNAFLLSLLSLDEWKVPLRVIVLTRKHELLDLLDERCRVLFADSVTRLESFDIEKSDSWQLYRSVFEKLQQQRDVTETPHFTRRALYDWQHTSPLHREPIFILALALSQYFSSELDSQISGRTG